MTLGAAILTAVVSILGGGFGSLALRLLSRRLEKRDTQTTQITVVSERETTARHKLATGARMSEDRVLARLHDACRQEVADARERIEALFEVIGTTQVELARVVGKLTRCEEQHEEQRRTSLDLSERLSRVEKRSNPPPAMEPAE